MSVVFFVVVVLCNTSNSYCFNIDFGFKFYGLFVKWFVRVFYTLFVCKKKKKKYYRNILIMFSLNITASTATTTPNMFVIICGIIFPRVKCVICCYLYVSVWYDFVIHLWFNIFNVCLFVRFLHSIIVLVLNYA